ncbi:MAG: hypothetical protein RLZZ214_2323 [Verrucomicrobiota bacterium]|jgi:hypothetical protein
MLESHLPSAAKIWSSLASKLNGFAKQSRLVQRVSNRFRPEDFLLTLLDAVSTGRASINQLVGTLGKHAPLQQISPQALHQRINRTECGVESFLILCLIHMCRRNRPAPNSSPRAPFNRILIEDSTFVRFPKGNAEHFPGHGNGHGKTAGCKVDLAFDLFDGDIVYHELHLGTEQDKTIGYDLLQHVLPGDLVVRDMGYFVLENFRIIESLDAYWLSRLPLTADVTTEQGVPLEKRLATHRGDQLDLTVKLTAERHSVRLVAIRASKQETAKRRREHRTKAKEKGKTVPCKTLVRDGWHIMVTNIPKEKQSITELAAIYSQRWQIEIIFRAWKQGGNLSQALDRTSSPQHLKALVLAGMIAMSASLKVALPLSRCYPAKRFSLEKVFDYIIAGLVGLKKLIDIANLRPDPRHLQSQKRTRNTLNLRLMELLG